MGPYHILRPPNIKDLNLDESKSEQINFYTTRIIKLIPSDVLALFVIGRNAIPVKNNMALMIWALVCLLGVIVSRYSGSRKSPGSPPQYATIFISAISFLIWLYSFGNVFNEYFIYQPWLSTLLMIGWIFFLPFFYKGDKI